MDDTKTGEASNKVFLHGIIPLCRGNLLKGFNSSHQEEQRKELAERQKDFDERQKKWDKRDDEWRKQGLFRNPWTQPREIAYLLLTLALVVLSITVYLLARR